MTTPKSNSALYKSFIGPIRISWNNEGLLAIKILNKLTASSKESIPNTYKKLFDSFFSFYDEGPQRKIDLKNKVIYINQIPYILKGIPDSYIKIYYELLKIPRGKTISYGELAEKAGYKNGGRLVGTAMAKNPFPLIIPCHRVILASGKTGNYSYGPVLKMSLLKTEGAL
jgi:methylated-DNA-[protein]-cysteine S-methyltransferase